MPYTFSGFRVNWCYRSWKWHMGWKYGECFKVYKQRAYMSKYPLPLHMANWLLPSPLPNQSQRRWMKRIHWLKNTKNSGEGWNGIKWKPDLFLSLPSNQVYTSDKILEDLLVEVTNPTQKDQQKLIYSFKTQLLYSEFYQ